MAYVVTQNCCKDASCVSACPVNCIHPAPGEADYGTESMLYVDPAACIDCGACADACPVDAIVPGDRLTTGQRVYLDLNAGYYADRPPAPAPSGPTFRSWDAPSFEWTLPSDFAGLDVAVVGTGPAGLYAAEYLLLHTPSRVTLIDRLPVLGGLVRYGVAPDHPGTKRIGDAFARLHDHPRVRMLLGVEVGRDVTVAELGEHFDAVIYAVGASRGRRLGVPGDDLPGTWTAPEFVGWYNAHPDVPAGAVTLDGERAVVVGTGNVALDIARVLTAGPDALAGTDIAAHALDTLRRSPVREVVLLARRGPDTAAYSAPELLALRAPGTGVDLVVDDTDPRTGAAIDAAGPREHAALLQRVPRARPDLAANPAPGRRIVLRFHSTVERVEGGAAAATGVRLTDGTTITATPVIASIGYLGHPIDGLPYDPADGTVAHEHGRVAGTPGAYVVGWCKRGATGGIGDNRTDAADTVHALLDDAVAGRLATGSEDGARRLERTLRSRKVRTVDAGGLERILRAERERGRREQRPAVKLATREDLLAAARR